MCAPINAYETASANPPTTRRRSVPVATATQAGTPGRPIPNWRISRNRPAAALTGKRQRRRRGIEVRFGQLPHRVARFLARQHGLELLDRSIALARRDEYHRRRLICRDAARHDDQRAIAAQCIRFVSVGRCVGVGVAVFLVEHRALRLLHALEQRRGLGIRQPPLGGMRRQHRQRRRGGHPVGAERARLDQCGDAVDSPLLVIHAQQRGRQAVERHRALFTGKRQSLRVTHALYQRTHRIDAVRGQCRHIVRRMRCPILRGYGERRTVQAQILRCKSERRGNAQRDRAVRSGRAHDAHVGTTRLAVGEALGFARQRIVTRKQPRFEFGI